MKILDWIQTVTNNPGEGFAGVGLYFIVAVLIAVLIEILILRFLIRMLTSARALRHNYSGRLIPVGLGLSFIITVMVVFFLYALLGLYDDSYSLFIIGAVIVSFLGFIDDMLGQRDKLGLQGHLGALWQGELTTGGLKAVGGLGLAVFIAFFTGGSWWDIAVNALVIALFTNTINLLDLQPGRAIKGYLFFLIIIIAAARGGVDWMLIAPLLGAVLIYWLPDLKALVMMGDTGSNVLGFALGYMSVVFLELPWRLGFLVFLIILHVFTEYYSISQIIDRVGIFRSVDNWGRSWQDDQPTEIDR